MTDRSTPDDAGAADAPTTYTIFVRDFAATVALAGRTGRCGAHIDLRLAVRHPGPGFADDIAAVMSYEGIVQDLRDLCAGPALSGAQALADRAAAAGVAYDDVIEARATATLDRPDGGDGGDAHACARATRCGTTAPHPTWPNII